MSKKHNKMKSKLAAFSLAVLMLGSAVPAYAQTEDSQEQVISLEKLEQQNLLQEYTEQLSQLEVENSILYNNESLIAPLSVSNLFSWSIPAKTRKSTTSFEGSNGGVISVKITSTSGYMVHVGIIDPDNIFRYVNITDSGSHDFKLTKDGNYRIQIYNENSVQVTVKGRYIY